MSDTGSFEPLSLVKFFTLKLQLQMFCSLVQMMLIKSSAKISHFMTRKNSFQISIFWAIYKPDEQYRILGPSSSHFNLCFRNCLNELNQTCQEWSLSRVDSYLYKLVLLWAQLTKIYPRLPTSVQPISITKTLLIVPTKNERDPPLFTGKLLIKF